MNRTFLLLLAGMSILFGACSLPSNRVESKNTEVVREVFSEVWSKGNVGLIDALYAEDYIGHFPGETFHGRKGIRSHVLAHRKAFPDWTEEVEDTITEGNQVVARFRSRGTNLGEFLNNAPTGKRIEITEVAIFRLKDGKIAEQWVYPEMLSMQRQLRGDEQP